MSIHLMIIFFNVNENIAKQVHADTMSKTQNALY